MSDPLPDLPDGWQYKRIDSLLSTGIRDFGSFSMTNLIEFLESGVPFIKSEAVNHGRINFDKLFFISEKVHRLLYKSYVNKGDILFTKIGAIGRVAVYDGSLGTCNSNAATAKIKVDRSKADPSYVAHQLASERVFRDFERSIISTPPRINLGEINAMEIACPSPPEQRKTARILTTQDNLIEKTEALIAKYQSIKQGMMHDLFTRGVDARGRLRPTHEQAPDLYKQSELGWIPKEWEVKTTLQLASDESGSTTLGPFGSDLVSTDYRTTGVPVVFVRDIKENEFCWKSNVFVSQTKANSLRAHSVRAGDIVVTKMGLPPCVAAIYSNSMPNGIITADIIRHRPDKSKVNTVWLCAALNSDPTKRQVAAITAGVTRPKVTLADYRNLQVSYPLVEEQSEIARRLTALNKKIDNERSALAKHQLVKQGLMQDLLTGKVRVNVE